MNEAQLFSQRLQEAMSNAGYEARPIVLEREFNQRYWGRSISFQAVRRWLQGNSKSTCIETLLFKFSAYRLIAVN